MRHAASQPLWLRSYAISYDLKSREHPSVGKKEMNVSQKTSTPYWSEVLHKPRSTTPKRPRGRHVMNGKEGAEEGGRKEAVGEAARRRLREEMGAAELPRCKRPPEVGIG